MRYLTLNITADQILSIDNSMMGVETIYMNEEVVSKKFSFWGAKHMFSREENGKHADYEVEIGLSFVGIGYNIHRNGESIMMSNNVSKLNKFSWVDVIAYFVLFVAAGVLGYTVARGFLNADYDFTKAILPTMILVVSGAYLYWRKNFKANR